MGRGFPLMENYTYARPGGRLQGKFGSTHAKVVFFRQSQVVLVGSANYTTSSMCNHELTTQIALSPTGLQWVDSWFQERWSEGASFSPTLDEGRPASRARSQGAPRFSRPGDRSWAMYASPSGLAPPWRAER